MTLRTLNYGNYGIFLIMGNAGFRPSAVLHRCTILDPGILNHDYGPYLAYLLQFFNHKPLKPGRVFLLNSFLRLPLGQHPQG